MDSIQLAIANLSSVPVLAFLLGVSLVLIRSQLQVPGQIFEFLSMYLLLSIGIKGGVALSVTPPNEVWLPILLAVLVGALIPVVVFFSLRAITPLDKINRGAIAAHYGSTSLVTFTAGLVFLENSGLKVEGYMPSLLAVMEVPGLIIGILLAKKAASRGSLSVALNEVLTSKSVVLLLGGIAIGLATGPDGYGKVEPFFGGIFSGMLAIFLLQLGIQAGRSLQEVRNAGFGLLGFAVIFPLLAGTTGVWLAQTIGISQGGSVAFGLLCASASYIAAPAAVRLSLPEAKPGLYITTSLGVTFPINLFIGIPLLTWFARLLS